MVWYSHLFQNFPQFFVIQAVSSCDECGLRLVAVHGLLTEVAPFVTEHRLE